MAVPIISASGVQYGLLVNSDGSLNVSGTLWTGVGSVLTQNPVYVTPSGAFFISGNVVNVGSVAVTNTGSIISKELPPTNSAYNNPAFYLTFSGGVLTRVVQYIGAGSYIKDLTYSGTTLATAGSWW